MNTKTLSIKQSSQSIVFWFFTLAALIALGVSSKIVFAANGVNTDSSGVAIQGYDTVAYFTQSKAVKGNSQFVAEHNGTKWYFSSAANKQAFTANPTAYLPQYGGYCAFAASRNAIAPIDPEAWTIHNNKLYLNFSVTVRETWSEDISGNISAADDNWPSLIKQVL